jgi:hypothetical protein
MPAEPAAAEPPPTVAPPPPPAVELVPPLPAELEVPAAPEELALLPAVPVEPLEPDCAPALDAMPAEPGCEPVSLPEEQAATESNATEASHNVFFMSVISKRTVTNGTPSVNERCIFKPLRQTALRRRAREAGAPVAKI